MKDKNIKFKDIEKDCKFKTYQDAKCVNEKNRFFRLVGSCQGVYCPLMEHGVDNNPKGCIELMSKVTIPKSKIN